MPNSIIYAYVTISEVNNNTFAKSSKWSRVIYFSKENIFLIGTTKVITIAVPEKIAPATKYGAKMVVCQPGRILMAKSHETTE